MAAKSASRLLALARRYGPLVLIGACAIAAFTSGLTKHLSLHELTARREVLNAFVVAHPFVSISSYIGLYTVVVVLCLPAALVMTLTGGFLFGPWLGGVCAAISCTAGGVVVFLICRSAFGDALRTRAGPMVARIEAGVERDAFSYVLTLRLIPAAPLWLINIALGFFEIRLSVFTAATFLGLLPVSLIYAGLGASLQTMVAKGVRPHLHQILEPQVLWPLLALAALSLAPIAWRWFGRPSLPKSRL